MFRLSTKSRYGLRTLVELAIKGTEKPISLNELSQNQQISKKYLENIYRMLQKNAIVRSVRGAHGGYQMAKDPETVWNFINDLINRAKEKAATDIESLKDMKKKDPGNTKHKNLKPWDISYFNNQILKSKFKVDHEKIREYLPMEQCLEGVFTIYQELLGLEFRKVENPSVWHEEIEMYEVYENEQLKGRFYLDLIKKPGSMQLD